MNIEDLEFKGIDYYTKALLKGNYDNCSFIDCNFSNADLKGIKFEACSFINCNFTMCKIQNTSFRSTIFSNCKLLGVHFNNCNNFLLSFKFENCLLNLSSFVGLTIKNTIFDTCSMEEVDFSDADISLSVFNECELSRSIFNHTILKKCDFRSAQNFAIDPQLNQIQKAKFSTYGLSGLLLKYQLHIE